MNLTKADWKKLPGDPAQWEKVRLDTVHHIVHDYANFVSSAEMQRTGLHMGQYFKPPINTHIFHAFLLNCRKMADFLSCKRNKEDDVIAEDYVSEFRVSLPNCERWRDPVHKQLQHLTYTRDTNPREITSQACIEMYNELKQAWKGFRSFLSNPFADKFAQEITDKLKPESEFKDLDLW
jgi:hypothetical protein